MGTLSVELCEPLSPGGTDAATQLPAGVGVTVGVGVGVGDPAQGFPKTAVLRGLTLATTKSAALSSVSAQPAPFLTTALVDDGAAATPLPSKQFVPRP